MSNLRVLLAAALLLAASAAAPRAEQPSAGGAEEASLGVLLDAIRSNRKAFVAVNLQLTDDQSSRFWPLYERYQKEMNAIGDRQARVVQDYTASFRDLSNEKALELMNEYLATEADRVQVRRTYLGEFAKILPGRTVARLYQLENKLDAVIRYELAATIPVVEPESATPAR